MLANVFKYSLIVIAIAGCTAKEKPVASSAAVVPAPEAIKRANYHAEVLFEFERAELSREGRKALDDFAQKLVASDLERLIATAHADRIGDAAYNQRLSERRAEAIRDYLVERGVPVKLLRVEGKGAREPVTAGRCDAMGPENKQNGKLIACLQPDRRAEIEVTERASR